MSFTEGLLPPQPEEPLPEDCCGNGCNPCVLDVYQDLLQKWKTECTNINKYCGTASNNSVSVLSMTRYMPFQLVSIQKLTDNTNIYRFQAVVVTGRSADESLGTNDRENIEAIKGKIVCLPGQHLILRSFSKSTDDRELGKLGTEEKAVTRAYTLISSAEDHDKGKFNVMIKLYEKGIMSRFISQLQVGDVTSWRGPYGSFKYERNSFSSVLMLCAGTGLAPLYSIAKSIVSDGLDDTIVRMLFACKSEQDILLRNEIRALSSFWNFRADIFLSNDHAGLARYGETLKFGRIGREEVEREVEKLSNKCFILICGPPSFMDSMAEIAKTCSVPTERLYIFKS